MLKDGEKGAVIQRDKKTYAIVPHLGMGLVTPEQLRRLADVSEKYGATLKLTSAQRIALVGIREEEVDAVWSELDINPGAAIGLCVRSVKACPGTTFCRLAKGDSLALATELDRRYHGMKLPWKFKIGVSGCPNQCAENCIKDLGFHAKNAGWIATVGGNGGARPLLARELKTGLDDQQALDLAERIIDYFNSHAKKTERLGRLIKRVGFDEFKDAILS